MHNPFSHAKDLCIVGEGYILGFKISRTYNINTTLYSFSDSFQGILPWGGALFLAILEYWTIIYIPPFFPQICCSCCFSIDLNIYKLVELRTSVVVMPGNVLTAAAPPSLKCTKLTNDYLCTTWEDGVSLQKADMVESWNPCWVGTCFGEREREREGLVWLKVGTNVGWVLALEREKGMTWLKVGTNVEWVRALNREGLTCLKVGTNVGCVLALAGQNSHQFQIQLELRIDPKWIKFSEWKPKINTFNSFFFFPSRIQFMHVWNRNRNHSSLIFQKPRDRPGCMFFIKKKVKNGPNTSWKLTLSTLNPGAHVSIAGGCCWGEGERRGGGCVAPHHALRNSCLSEAAKQARRK